MAAGPWIFYNSAKKHICDGSIDLDTSTFQIALFTSASNAALSAVNITAYGEITNQVAAGFGYLSSGKPLTGVTWGQGASVGEQRFDCTAVVWTAAGGNIANVKFAVIWVTGASAGARKTLCYSQLSSSQFTVTSGNTLTVQPSANGIFELN